MTGLIRHIERLSELQRQRLAQLDDDEVCVLEILQQTLNAYRLGYLRALMDDLQTAVQGAHCAMEEAYERAHNGQQDLFETGHTDA